MSSGSDRSLQMLSRALEMEKEGKAFYEEAVSACQNELGREMFRMLMKDGLLHMDRIGNIYESLRGGVRGRPESAGINRHRVGDERALHERNS